MALLGRLMAAGGHVVWIGPRDELFAPGLAELGLAPERLIMVGPRARAARLWALEEALRSPGLAAALAEVDRLSLTESRRLQLAAEAKGVSALLLRPPGAGATPSAAATRWLIEAAQRGNAQHGHPAWRPAWRHWAPPAGRARVRPAALAGPPVALPRRPHRQLAGRLAARRLA